MLHRILLRAIGRQGQQAHVLGNAQILCPVPSRPIPHHQDIVLSMTLGDFGKQHGPGESIHLGQNQGVERAVVRAECGERIPVRAHDPGADLQAHPTQGPARPGSLIRPKRASPWNIKRKGLTRLEDSAS